MTLRTIPIRRAGNRHNLFMGGDRELVMFAGVLAFAAKLMRPLPRLLAVNHKIRLIACSDDGPVDHGSLRDAVAALAGRGIDTRGIALAGPALSDEAIRHGAAYLVELVATAQRSDRFRVDRQWRRSAARLRTVLE